jgi:16S rRNA G527 N7-methylase RsmG
VVERFLEEYRDVLPALSAEQVAALEAHLELLERWNRTINLTAIRINDAISKHVGESLFLAAHLPEGALGVCDLGSGGGFPGIPVAIARPDCDVALVESDVRKGVFLREAARKLRNVTVVTERFEEMEGEFDWLIARAVNLSKTVGGPKCGRAAFLGSLEGIGSRNTKRSVVAGFRWRTVPVPWEPFGVLSLGECFT